MEAKVEFTSEKGDYRSLDVSEEKADSLRDKYEFYSETNEMKMVTDDSDDTDESSSSEELEEQGRAQWNRKAEYILSMIGFCVGLGNVWRFPYICIRNGGGAFLIPFVICLLVCGLPLYFLEVAMGQFLGKSSFHVYGFCPLLKGIGVSLNIIAVIVDWYYPMVLVWTLVYLAHSFKDPLPWTQCGQWWNSDNCRTTAVTVAMNNASAADIARMPANSSDILETIYATTNATQMSNVSRSASEEFWMNNVLEISPGFHEMGGLPWHNCVALLVATLIVLVAVIRGVKSVGKVVWVTATLPYVLLLVLLIRGATLPGAYKGVVFYLKPDFSKLMEAGTWLEACLQVFYSLGPCWGGLQTMASYNKFKNNCMRDSILLSLFCEGTSVFAGFAIFTILGHMSETLNIPIEEFAQAGPGLAFVVYPEAISYLPVPQIWAVLFFIMLLTVGLDSCLVQVEIPLTTLADHAPKLWRRHHYVIKMAFMAVMCMFSLVFCSRGGLYYFTLVDWYFSAVTMLVIGVLECVGVTWFYGSSRFRYDISLMIGSKPPQIFTVLWKYVIPILLSIVWVVMLSSYKPPSLNNYTFGPGAIGLGWVLAFSSFIPIPCWAIYIMMKASGTLKERFRAGCKPSDDWRPSDPALRAQYVMDTKQLPAPGTCSPSCLV